MRKFLAITASIAFITPSANANELADQRMNALIAAGQKMCIYERYKAGGLGPEKYKEYEGIDYQREKTNREKKVPWLKTQEGRHATVVMFKHYMNFLTCEMDEKYNTSGKSNDELTTALLKELSHLISEESTPYSTKEEKNARTTPVNNVRDRCLKAADYEGCMTYETGQKETKSNELSSEIINARKFNKGKDCSKRLCMGTGEKDFLGKPSLVGWLYKESPAENNVLYIDPKTYKVKVRGKYGRYIHISKVYRYYQNPEAGTSGYSSGLGTATCTPGFGGSLDCTTTTFDVSGTPARPGGLVQYKVDQIIDCKEGTTISWWNGQKNHASKWRPLGKKSIGARISIGATIAETSCSRISSLEKSNFTKYE